MVRVDAGDLSGRSAIVTGGSRGIGLEIARALTDAGAQVLITSRSQQSAEQAASQIGDGVEGFGAHAADEGAAKRCVERALERFGRIDVLVNNAGTNPAFGPLIELDRARFEKTFEVNVWAPILWSRLVFERWMGEHGGVIVNVASIGGLAVGPNTGAYRTSKAAMIHLTRQLAFELAPHVRVNAVAPGLVRTRMAEALWKGDEDRAARGTLLGRIGEPRDVAGAVAFLCSERASWITGETLVIDGGQIVAGMASGHGGTQ